MWKNLIKLFIHILIFTFKNEIDNENVGYSKSILERINKIEEFTKNLDGNKKF